MGNTYDIILKNGTCAVVSSWIGSPYGHKMQVPAGATSVLDVPGPVNSELEFVPNRGGRLNLGCLHHVRSGHGMVEENPGAMFMNHTAQPRTNGVA